MTDPGKRIDVHRYVRPKDIDQRATLSQRALWRLEAFGWDWAYWKIMKAMSVEKASAFGASLLRRLGPLANGPHRTMIRNLRMAFPDWSEAEIDKTARGAWETLGHIAGEMPHLADMHPYDSGRIEVVGAEKLDAVKASGKPVVFFGGHMANWEYLAPTITLRPLDCLITYRAANNPHIDKCISDARFASGVEALAPKGIGTRELMRSLDNGVSVALMNDQKFNQGIAVPFFGYDAMTAPGPTRLAMRFGVPLMPMSILRMGPARYRATVYDPFMPDDDPDEATAVYNTVLKINRFMEDRIREAPDQWFWMHNRWPKDAWVKAGVM
ncbi:MAG: lipid A biosynthesis acyltransferase [Alphaproteobacteria bacterium]|nr:lipid A biosynthesis acyltransferase [Alphaproteobacteria bacterium]